MREHLSRLAKGTAIYGLGGLLSRVIGFLLLPLFTAYLTPADYGVIGMLGLLGFLLTPVFSLGLGTSIGLSYFEPSGGDRKAATIWAAFALLLASAAVLALLSALFSKEISVLLFRTDAYARLVLLSALTACGSVLLLPFTLFLQLEERPKLFVTLATFSSLVTILLTVLMVVGFRSGVRGYVEAGLIGQAVTLLAFLCPAFRLPFRLDGRVVRDLLRHGVPMIPSFASLFVLQQGNRYVLEHYRGLEALGLYTVGYNIGFAMSLAVNAFTSAWPPYFLSFSDRKGEAAENFGRVTTYYVLGFGAASLLFYLFARPVVLVMTKPPFHAAWGVVGLTATACFLNGAFSLFLPPVYFAKEVRSVAVVQLLAAVLSLGAAIALIVPYGVVGAALSLAAGSLVMPALMHAWNSRRGERYLRTTYEWGRIGAFAGVYAAFAAASSVRRDFSLPAEFALSIAGTAALLCVVYSLLRESERKALIRSITRRAA